MGIENGKQKKKKTIIIASVLGIIILLIGAFLLGRISVKKPLEPKPKNNLPPEIPKQPNDNPEPVPGDRKEEKFDYVTLLKENNADYHVFRNSQDWRVIYVSKKHPEIKRLLRERKL